MLAMNTTTAGSLPAGTASLRQDAHVIGLVGIAHLVSHFSQLLLAPLFPWLKDAFNVSYAELGFLMTLFFVTSCAVQAASGFVVDRFGPRPVLFGGLALLALAAFGYAASTHYWMLALFSVVAGVGNGVFHPVDYTLLNRKISAPRLGHAYSVHGITGSLGWALAPALVVPITIASSWRVALACAGLVAVVVLVLLLLNRDKLSLPVAPAPKAGAVGESNFGFLRIPAVWMCFAFFFFYAVVLGNVQAFAPGAARELHAVPLAQAALCVTVYMVCSALAMVAGGFLAADPARCEKLVALGFGFGACVALALGLLQMPGALVPVMFGLMGLGAGIAGPSRDMIVKRSTPPNASGRVYGVVYSGLDIGQAIAPLIFGTLMDRQQYSTILVGLAMVQAVLIASAFKVGTARRTALGTRRDPDQRVSLTLIAWVVAGAAVAGFVQGLSGFAFSMVALSFWAWALDPLLAALLAIFGGWTGQVIAATTTRRVFDKTLLWPFLAGGLCGMPIGFWLLPRLDVVVFQGGTGALLLVVWCPLMLVSGQVAAACVAAGASATALAGLAGGVMSGVGGLSGVVPTLWCTLRGFDRDAQRAVIQNFNLAMLSVALGAACAGGPHHRGHAAAAGHRGRRRAAADVAGRAPVRRPVRGSFPPRGARRADGLRHRHPGVGAAGVAPALSPVRPPAIAGCGRGWRWCARRRRPLRCPWSRSAGGKKAWCSGCSLKWCGVSTADSTGTPVSSCTRISPWITASATNSCR